MKEERKKILKMLGEGIISPEEAEELLDTLSQENEKGEQKTALGNELKEDLRRAKEGIVKAKEVIKKKFEDLDLKEKARLGLEKADEGLREFGSKIKDVFTKEGDRD